MLKLAKSFAVCTCMLAITLGSTAVAKTPKSDTPAQNFLGKWQLDKKKTSESAAAPGSLIQEIKPTSDGKLLVKSQYDQPKNGMYPLIWLGIMVEQFTLSADGSETVNDIGPFRHVGKTTVEGNKMTTTWNATIENGTIDGQWVRTLSPDGKEMTMQVTSKASDGRTFDSTIVFHRK